MTYSRFEELPVWKAAVGLAEAAYALCRTAGSALDRDSVSQLRRAALSVSNNIAEGFERGTTPELLSFLYIARGSAGEVRSMCYVLERLPELENLKFEISNLKSSAESIARQLRAWADQLQNSPIQGQRRLNEETRKGYRYRKDIEEAEQWLAGLRAKFNSPETDTTQKAAITNLKSQI